MAHRTEGHKMLAQSGKPPAEVARGTGRTVPTVMRWFSNGKPDIDSAIALRDFMGIPVEAWRTPKRRAS